MISLYSKNAILLFCALFIFAKYSYAQETVQNELSDSSIEQSNNQEINCSRLSLESDFFFAYLNPYEEYLLTFEHGIILDESYAFFDQSEVKEWWFEDDILHFIPAKASVIFHNPGHGCDGETIDQSNFNVTPLIPLIQKEAQLTTISGHTPEYLVQTVLLGDFCLNITNIEAPGGPLAIGQFGSDQAIGIPSGVIMTSGNISTAEGPNNTTGASSSVGTAGADPDLAALVGNSSTNDVAILEFDFVPDLDSISFEYVFASEEYCDYVGSQFNDGFGFFISGPGINGPYSNNAENLALIPNTSTVVSINNVNFLSNSQYYVSNANPNGGNGGSAACSAEVPVATGKDNAEIQFDGFTTVLKAKSVVVPCETYHIKIAICDTGDALFDSGVFLAKNSFVSGTSGVKMTATTGYIKPINGIAAEGCSGAYIAFRKWNVVDFDVVMDIIIESSSTATEGVDYANLPSTFTLPTNTYTDTLWIDIFSDLLIEGIESIDISIGGVCDCVDPLVQVFINDPDQVVIEPLEDLGFCSPQIMPIDAIVSGGLEPYQYDWSNGGDNSTSFFDFQIDGYHYLTVTDICSVAQYDTFYVEFYPNYEEFQEIEICEGDSYFVGGFPQTTGGDYVDVLPTLHSCDSIINTHLTILPIAVYDTLIYSCFGESIYVNGTTISTPNTPTDVHYYNLAANGCDSIITVTMEWLNPFSSIDNPDTLNCIVDMVQLMTIVPNSGEGIVYEWTGPNYYTSNEESPWVTEPGEYTLVVTQTVNGVFCESIFPFSNTVPIDTLAPIITPLPDLTIACGITELTFEVVIENFDEINGIIYEWTGPNNFVDSTLTTTVSDSGTYVFTAINPISHCVTTEEVHISIEDVEPEIFGIGASLGCEVDSIQVFSEVNLTSGDFSWSGPNSYQATSQNPFVYESGTYFVSYFISDECIAFDTIEVNIDNTIPDLSAIGDTIICGQGNGILNFESETTGITFEWTGPNNFTSDDESPNVLDEGLYTIVVTGANGCTNEQIVELHLIDIIPELEGVDGIIDCTNPITELIAEVEDNSLSYAWEGPDEFTSNSNSPTTSTPGEYSLTVTNVEGCDNSTSIIIEDDTQIPIIMVSPVTINCSQESPTIDVTEINEELLFSWTGPNGYSSDLEDIIIDEPGVYSLVITADNGCENSYSIPIEIDTIHPIFVSIGDTLDCNNGTAEISALILDPNYDFDITWFDDTNTIVGTEATENVAASGVFTIIVTNQDNGCSSTQSVEVFNNDDVPELEVLGDTINCYSSTYSVFSNSETAGIIYSWTGPNSFTSTESNPTVFDPGTYTVTISAPNGCIAIDEVEVLNDNEVPTINTENDELNCNIEELILFLETTGNDNQYSWTGPDIFESSDINPIVTEPGTYTILVTSNNGCSAEETVIITQDIAIPMTSLSSSNDLDCTNESSDIDLLTDAPPLSTFLWEGPNAFISDQEDIIITDPGTYQVTVTGTNGCTNVDDIEISQDITEILITANDGLVDCYHPNLELDIIYSSLDIIEVIWNGPNDFDSNELNPTVEDGGLYSVMITGSNGCTSSASLNIDNKISYPETELTGEVISCLNTEATISSTFPGDEITYEWENSSGNPIDGEGSIQVSESGIYFLTLTNPENGCTTIKSIEITELPELLSFDFTKAHPNCNVSYGEITFHDVVGGTGPFSYSIDNGETYVDDPFFTNLTSGDYDIIIKDNAGCELSSTTNVLSIEEFDVSAEDLYVLVLGVEQELEVITTIPENEIQSITWFPEENLSCTNCLNPILYAVKSEIYTVTVVDKNGCELIANIEIRVADNPIYVPNIFTPNGDNVNEFFTIFGDFNTIELVTDFYIYDRWGNKVKFANDVQPEDDAIKWNGSFNGEGAQTGVYAYYIRYLSIDGTYKVLVGDVSLIR